MPKPLDRIPLFGSRQKLSGALAGAAARPAASLGLTLGNIEGPVSVAFAFVVASSWGHGKLSLRLQSKESSALVHPSPSGLERRSVPGEGYRPGRRLSVAAAHGRRGPSGLGPLWSLHLFSSQRSTNLHPARQKHRPRPRPRSHGPGAGVGGGRASPDSRLVHLQHPEPGASPLAPGPSGEGPPLHGACLPSGGTVSPPSLFCPQGQGSLLQGRAAGAGGGLTQPAESHMPRVRE